MHIIIHGVTDPVFSIVYITTVVVLPGAARTLGKSSVRCARALIAECEVAISKMLHRIGRSKAKCPVGVMVGSSTNSTDNNTN